jgi:hypothetical protein
MVSRVYLGHIRGSNACAESSKGPVSAGVRVSPYQEQAGQGKALLRKDLMADTAAGVEEVCDILLSGPRPDIPL